MNYFEHFSLPALYAVDEALLQSQYFKLQRQHHPDKAGLGAVQESMKLNQAYDTLKDPLKRGQYFLSLHGVDVGNDDSQIKPCMELLEEMMEKREAVVELDDASAAESLMSQAKSEYEKELVKFSELAKSIENNKESAAQSLLRLQYITKWQSEIKQQQQRVTSNDAA